jgi:Protein of unknown function (DUF2950)
MFVMIRNIRFAAMILLMRLLVSFFTFLSPMRAQEVEQTTFASPDEAGRAFFSAAKSDDDSALLAILGPTGREVISSGDAAEDARTRNQFVTKYEQMHRFSKQSDGTLRLVVGAENWPLPIPVVHGNRGWYFDTEAGKDEILFRRIGENETAAILALEELVDAQRQYFANGVSGWSEQNAHKIARDQTISNDLYWEQTAGVPESLFPLIAYAGNGSTGAPTPFYGYVFQVRRQQAPHDFVDGNMRFEFIAYPVEYRSSGVMTFIVNEAGIVYQKDLGPETVNLTKSMPAFNPDATWQRAN